MNTLESIKEWFEKAVPQPKIENQMMQMGCHFEEIKEMCHAMNLYCDDVVTQELRFKTNCLSYRRGIENMDSKEKAAVLDALCDQIVTAVGVGYMLGFDMIGALAEINASNWSKFQDGRPVFDGSGKIAKGVGYFKPNLTEFLGRGVSNAPTAE